LVDREPCFHKHQQVGLKEKQYVCCFPNYGMSSFVIERGFKESDLLYEAYV